MPKAFTDGAKVRVYALAKEVGKTGKELLPVLQEMGYEVKSVQNSLSADEANAVVEKLTKKAKKSTGAKKSTEKKTTAKKSTEKKATKKTTTKKTSKKSEVEEEEAPKPKKSTRSKKKTEDAEAVEEAKPKKATKAKKPTGRKSKKKTEDAVAEAVEEVVETATEESTKTESADEQELKFQEFALDYLQKTLKATQCDADAVLGKWNTSGGGNKLKYHQTLNIVSREGALLYGTPRMDRDFFAALRTLMTSICRKQFGLNVYFYFEVTPEHKDKVAVEKAEEAQEAPAETNEEVAVEAEAILEAAEEMSPEDIAFSKAILRLAHLAQKQQKAYVLSCMSARDRHRVHSALAESAELGVRTQSDGEGIFRRLLIYPRGMNLRQRPNPHHSNR